MELVKCVQVMLFQMKIILNVLPHYPHVQENKLFLMIKLVKHAPNGVSLTLVVPIVKDAQDFILQTWRVHNVLNLNVMHRVYTQMMEHARNVIIY